jgi:hypothetical protein
VESAGLEPGTINPLVAEVLKEEGEERTLDGKSLKDTLVDCGFTHVVWIPDSSTGA